MSESFLAADQNMETPPAAPEPAGPSSGGDAWSSVADDDLKGLIEAKGWKEPADALRSYKQLEGFVGADKSALAVLPKSEDDKEGFDNLYKALGRPDSPEGYELLGAVKEGEYDKDYLDAMGRVMHEAGLSKRQALTLTTANQRHFHAMQEALAAEHQAQVADAERTLSPEDKEYARRGFRFLGLENKDAVAIEHYLGVKRAGEMFGKIGRAMGEDRPIEGAKNAGSFGSPEAAKRRMDELLADPLFSKRYMAGDQSAIDEMAELSRKATAGN